MNRGLELRLLDVAFGDGLDQREHFIGRLGADKRGDGVLAYGETDGEVSETGEGVGSGLRGAVTVLFF